MIFRHFKQLYPKERNQTADLLKGFAVLCMIQVHLMELFAKQEIYDSRLGNVSLFLGGPPAAPLFMAVMGFFLANTRKSFTQNLKRGLILILGGILLNVGLNFHLLTLIYLKKIQLDPLRYIFGADILPLAGLSIILIAVIKKVFSEKYYTRLISSILIIIFILIADGLSRNYIIANRSLTYIQAFFWGNISWSYFPFLPWAVYPLIGFLLGMVITNFKLSETQKDFLALLSVLITFFTIEYGAVVASDLKTYYHHNWLYSLWVFQFLILLTCSLHKLETFFGTNSLMVYVKWLGKNVTAVYVFQWLLIGNIATFLYRTQSVIALILWLGLIISAVTLFTFWFEKYSNLNTNGVQVKNYI